MDKGINIRSVLLLKKAVEILDYLGTKYDIEKLRKRPDICKEIINIMIILMLYIELFYSIIFLKSIHKYF